jgi:lipopolysaccharide/colanic/teichoic acid biosynthesis glycosyltransferase
VDVTSPSAFGKRALDLVVGLPLALVSLPVVGVAALVSLVALRANPFFVHERVGHGGCSFRIVKVRTLPTTTGAYVDKFALEATPVPRATLLLRQLHLDELPQLWLVVRGSMSLVGPRPEMRVLHDDFDPFFAELRCRIRPGLTGLWQISPHCVGLIGQRPEYDRIYVEMRSWRLDAWIAFRTVLKILGRGTVHLYEVPEWAFPRSSPRFRNLRREPAAGATRAA